MMSKVRGAELRILVSAGLLILAAASCTGEIQIPGNASKGGNHPDSDAPSTPPRSPESVEDCQGLQLDPGPSYLRRLNNREYARAVEVTLGISATDLTTAFPADIATGFDTSAVSQTLSLEHGGRYQNAAEELAKRALADDAGRTRLVGCDPNAEREICLRKYIGRIGKRLFRRALTSAELEDYYSLTSLESEGYAAAGVVIEALLQSPNFLFRVELGAKESDRPGLSKLTGYEVATRLAFFLTGGPPNEQLVGSAEAGKLDSAEGVEVVARNLLADPQVQSAMAEFTSQWFHLKNLATAMRSPERYPEFGPALAASMRAELGRMLSDALWGKGGNFLDLFTRRSGYLDAELAAVYRVPAPSGGKLVTFDYSSTPDRGGFFTTAAFLTASSRSDSTSPIQRGKYVREYILCDLPPNPPLNVPALMPVPGQSEADAEERHTSAPACAGCHLQIDPIGHGLERYDAIGRLRTTYLTGQPVRERGTVAGFDDSDFGGGVQLGAVVRASGDAQTCAVKQMFRWALGRPDDTTTANDACTVLTLAQSFKQSDFNFAELVVAFVKSGVFRYRRPHEP